MFKKKKNSYNIYQIHNEYEILYKNIIQKENHLKSIQFEIEQKIEETKKIEHEKILNLK